MSDDKNIDAEDPVARNTDDIDGEAGSADSGADAVAADATDAAAAAAPSPYEGTTQYDPAQAPEYHPEAPVVEEAAPSAAAATDPYRDSPGDVSPASASESAPQPGEFGSPAGYDQPSVPPASAQPSYGQPPYGQAPGQPAYGQAPGQPAYGQAPGQPAYGQAPGQPAYGQAPGQPAYGQAPGQPPYGQAPGQPAYGQPPYGQAPAYAAYGAPPVSTSKYWAFTFLLYIPYVGWLVALIVAFVQRSSAQRTGNPLAIGNAFAVVNFLLTFALTELVLLIVTFVIGSAGADPVTRDPSGLIAIPILLMFAVGVWALVMMIMGTVRSSRAVFTAKPSIPFLRA